VILLIDNFDSFTYNLNDYLLQLGAEVKIVRNNTSLGEIEKEPFDAIILSPGPGVPAKSGNMMEVIQNYYDQKPMLGICLGHQAIGEFFGATLQKAARPMHGKVSEISLEKDVLFKGLENRIEVTRYHSLILDNITSPLEVIAETNEGEVMAIRHKALPLSGIQFHPEAVMTTKGKEILLNWLTNYHLNK
jgi:anthranilate synthase/aminodeoxychorismate synthase-like glutamine amidotransferase